MANGLDKKETAMLQRHLSVVEKILTKGFLLGGGDEKQFKDLADKIRNRLSPDAPSALDDEYRKLLNLHGSIEHVKEALGAA